MKTAGKELTRRRLEAEEVSPHPTDEEGSTEVRRVEGTSLRLRTRLLRLMTGVSIGAGLWLLVSAFLSSEGWTRVRPYRSVLLSGLAVTVHVTVVAGLIATMTSVVLGIGRLSHRRLIRLPTGAVIEFFRGTSALVQLFWVFYALPLLPIPVSASPFLTAVVVLGLNWGCSGAEIVRGAVRAVPQSQIDACQALGLGFWSRTFRVILPQALPIALPPYANLMIDLLKNSAIVSIVLVQDLVYWAEQVRLTVGETRTIYTLVLVMYFVLAVLIAAMIRFLERRASGTWRKKPEGEH
jgi:polar amino acid transport system permease protein